MENSESSCVPPGFRFHPTDEELVGYYLKKKVACQKIDLDVIRDIDLYRIEPWDLQDRCRIGYEEQSEWYFFSHKDKKYPTGTRTNRATMAGFWKATGRDKAVYDKRKLIGMRKTLVFYKGRAPNGQKTDWIMHEYRLESEENGPPQEEGWVVCRAFKKRTNTSSSSQSCRMSSTSTEGWDLCYDVEPSSTTGLSSVLDSIDYQLAAGNTNPPQSSSSTSPTRHQFIICKEEMETTTTTTTTMDQNLNNSSLHPPVVVAEPFLHLPQLHSPPSLPLIKEKKEADIYNHDIIGGSTTRTSSVRSGQQQYYYSSSCIEDDQAKVTDWRTLDRFVASQLSSEGDDQRRRYDGRGSSGVLPEEEVPAVGVPDHDHHHHHHQDYYSDEMEALLLVQGGRRSEEGNKLNGLFTSPIDSDHFGICIFEK
ncbi:hypothetical protein H6P81_018930 [Aristolochia fimbriata]|uniref:NAC domain-containing protein n=1 Tax=Aristolochia fimbriata TaxID=158543 RepID=A0AAV7E3X5_ARIFI|nr:hypothetical protein H6P81_018930 [Aristolochia fimbriata]